MWLHFIATYRYTHTMNAHCNKQWFDCYSLWTGLCFIHFFAGIESDNSQLISFILIQIALCQCDCTSLRRTDTLTPWTHTVINNDLIATASGQGCVLFIFCSGIERDNAQLNSFILIQLSFCQCDFTSSRRTSNKQLFDCYSLWTRLSFIYLLSSYWEW